MSPDGAFVFRFAALSARRGRRAHVGLRFGLDSSGCSGYGVMCMITGSASVKKPQLSRSRSCAVCRANTGSSLGLRRERAAVALAAGLEADHRSGPDPYQFALRARPSLARRSVALTALDVHASLAHTPASSTPSQYLANDSVRQPHSKGRSNAMVEGMDAYERHFPTA